MRLTTAIGALIPFYLWVVKETISNQVFSRKDILKKGKVGYSHVRCCA